jgi:hypothetical protein
MRVFSRVRQVRAVFCPKLCVIDNAEFRKLHIEASRAKLAWMAAEKELDKWQSKLPLAFERNKSRALVSLHRFTLGVLRRAPTDLAPILF